MDVKVGTRVVRGPDWSWEDQDGGEGNVGTVVEVKELTSDGEDSVLCGTTVIVCWDIGMMSNYRCGFGGKYDVRVYDNAQTGVSHPMVICNGCSTSPVYGMRWKCATCYDYDLCTECYMSNKHSLEHRFLRYDTQGNEGVPVPARSGGRRVKAKGFFKGAIVSRGKDWSWNDQDGGIGSTGTVKEIKGWHNESYRSIGEVRWESSDASNIYRVCHKGKVDLKCDTPGDGGEYYPDHLPMSEIPSVRSAQFMNADSAVHSKPNGVNTSPVTIIPACTTTSTTTSTTAAGTNASKGKKEHCFENGDVIRVIDDVSTLLRLQMETGEWNDDMALSLGQVGQVISVLGNGNCFVEVSGLFWELNPKALVPVSREFLSHVPAVGYSDSFTMSLFSQDVDSVRRALLQNPEKVHDRIDGKTALNIAVNTRNVRMVQLLLEYKANVNLQDEDSIGPLHLACHKPPPCVEIIAMLLEEGADPSMLDHRGHNSLHICTRSNCVKGCELILKRFPHLINVTTALDGYSPLHIACGRGHFEVAKCLLENGKCDINAVTRSIHTALHLAVNEGCAAIVELLVGHGIDLDVVEERGITALHIVLGRKSVVGISEDSPELSKIRSTLSDLDSSMIGSTAVACLLVREGADPYCKGGFGESPLEICQQQITSHVLRYTGQRSTFYGSLRKSPKPTPADLVEEENTPKPQKTAEESSKPRGERGPVEDHNTDVPTVAHMDTHAAVLNDTPTDTPLPQTTLPPQQPPDDDDTCLLCDRPVDVRIEPCGHTVLCRSHANTAKRCPQCRGPIHITPTNGPTTSATPTSESTTSATPTNELTTSTTPTSGPTTSATPTSGPTTNTTPASGPTTSTTPASEFTTSTTPTSELTTSTKLTSGLTTSATPISGLTSSATATSSSDIDTFNTNSMIRTSISTIAEATGTMTTGVVTSITSTTSVIPTCSGTTCATMTSTVMTRTTNAMPTSTSTTAAMTISNRTSTAHTTPGNMNSDNTRHVFQKGDVVRVCNDLSKVYKLQQDRGGWNDGIALALGELGRVSRVFTSGDCAVGVNGSIWVLNARALTPAPGEVPPDVPVIDHKGSVYQAVVTENVDNLRGILSRRPERANDKIDDKPILSIAASVGNKDIVRLLLEYKANVNAQDSGLGVTALHVSCEDLNSDKEIIEMLLEAGADPTITNSRSFNSLHHSARAGCLQGCELILRKYPHLINVCKPDGFGPLHLASINGDYSLVKFLVEQDDCDINAVTFGFHNSLHVAVEKCNPSVVELLVGHGIDLNIVDERGLTPLHIAVHTQSILGISDNSPELSKICSTLSDLDSSMIGSASVACLLVREGADPYCKGNVSRTPLEICSEELALHLIRYAATRSTFHGSLRTVPKPVQFDPCSKESLSNSTASPSGCIALTTASQTPNVTSSNLITVPVATAPSTADPMTTAPMTTVLVTTAPMTTMALPTPAETTTLNSQTTMNSTSQGHSSNKAHHFKDGDVVRVIGDYRRLFQLQQGQGGWHDNMVLSLDQLGRVMCKPDERDVRIVKVNGDLWCFSTRALIPVPGEIPPDLPVVGHEKTVLYAVLANDVQTLREILPKRPVLDADTSSPLYSAVIHNHTECIRLLLEWKANPNVMVATGCTPLHCASGLCNVEAIQMLLKAGADPRIVDPCSFNSLQICARIGCLRGCELILEKYPSLVNVRKENGYRPLHLASIGGHLPVAKCLVQQERCDIDALTCELHTALHVAIHEGEYSVAELLVGHGVDLNVADNKGRTALHIAIGREGPWAQSSYAPQLSQIFSTLSDLPSSMRGSAAVACLLVREGADLDNGYGFGASPFEICLEELRVHLKRYKKERSTFHGSLRKSPKPTPADLVEEEIPEPQRTAKESSKSTDEPEPLGESKSVLQTFTPTDTPLPETTPPPQQPPDDNDTCLLCDRPADVQIEPCGHTVLCRSHANTAKRCPQCRGPIQSIADLEPLCGMCQESVCSVTLKPCDHMMCSDCALRMKFCFECKTKVTSKVGLQDNSQSPAEKSESDPTSITTTDSSVSISDESLLCEICVSNKKNTAFTCGHQFCYDCSLKVDKCPICREEIKFRIKLH